MRIKIDGFNGGDRTSLDLPAPQQKLLEALAATGKPLIVVLQSGSAVALNWANEHAAAVLEAWYPGVEGGTPSPARWPESTIPPAACPSLSTPALDGAARLHRLQPQGPHLPLLPGQAAVGIRLRPQLLQIQIRPGQALRRHPQSRRPDHRHRHRQQHRHHGRRRSGRSLSQDSAGRRPHPLPRRLRARHHRTRRTARKSLFKIDPRSLSSVDDQGNRSILAGKYTLTLGGAQPEETKAKSEAAFTVTGTASLPK